MKKMDNPEETIIRLEQVTIRVRENFMLSDTSWEINKDQNWAILGPNGSGKSSLVGALMGHVPVVKGKVTRNFPETAHGSIGYVSLELHQRLIAKEEELDEARFFSGRMDTFAEARQTILSADYHGDVKASDFDRIVKHLEIDYLLDRAIRFLSTGEMQKVLIARALMKSPKLLILDEPFEGLDDKSKERLGNTITGLMDEGMQIILVTHRFEEILSPITHVLCLKDCKVFLQGVRDEVLKPENLDRLYNKKGPVPISLPRHEYGEEAPQEGKPEVFVDMKNATIRYGDTPVLENLNWAMKRGENWAIVGPNGAGKTTLLSLIIGDNPQAYANEIYLFGKRKGSGESIWDIKRRIGVVSSELQIHYRKRMKARAVVLSGFFDSIGLYRKCGAEQVATAEQWMKLLGITYGSEWYDLLSYGQKRMVLLARSMVKSPTLLVLDEPCQGLDRSNRGVILDLIDHIGRKTKTHVLYATPHPDEIPSCITHVLDLERPEQV
ncbi:MAG: ATP-binding cassette domain-containing protein [Desulfobacteraceae bacterium]|jgi:molybdate transport system ATP-binding protein